MLTHARQTGVLLATLLLAVSGPALGYAQSRATSRFEAGLTIGGSANEPLAFANCGSRVAGRVGGRLGFRLAPSWHVDLRTQIVSGIGAPICFLCEACFCSFGHCVPFPPSAGPYVNHDGYYASPLAGSTFVMTSVGAERRLLGTPFGEWRVRGGAARIWNKHLWAPELSSSLHFGSGMIGGVFEVGVSHYSLHRTDTATSYLDGQVVGTTTSLVPVHETTIYVDVGFTIHPSAPH